MKEDDKVLDFFASARYFFVGVNFRLFLVNSVFSNCPLTFEKSYHSYIGSKDKENGNGLINFFSS